MKILFFCSNFYPESSASANRTYAHAKVWARMGNQVTIITCFPNFPLGKIYSGYKLKFRQVEYIDDIKIIRIASYIAENKGTTKRILSYLSYGLHACFHGFFESCDVVIGTSPQPFNLLPARFISFFKRKKFIFELRDIWPESIIAVNALGNSLALNLFKKWIQGLYFRADLMIPVTSAFKRKLIDIGISEKKIVVVKNGADNDVLQITLNKEEVIKKYNLPSLKYLVGYVGTVGMAHALKTIVESADIMKNNHNVYFIIMGSGAESDDIKNLIHDRNLKNIQYIEGGSRQEAINVTSVLDAVIVHLRDTELFKTVIPSKIFEVMYLKKPILLGVDGEAREIIEKEAGCGIFFQPENSVDLAEKIFFLHDNPVLMEKYSNSGYQHVVSEYARETLAKKMLAAIKDCY